MNKKNCRLETKKLNPHLQEKDFSGSGAEIVIEIDKNKKKIIFSKSLKKSDSMQFICKTPPKVIVNAPIINIKGQGLNV
jgi:hypothetical protein